MEAKHQIKSFNCNLHPSEPIQRVCLDQGVENSLRCIECILNSTDKASKGSIISLNDFLRDAAKHYENHRGVRKLGNVAPEELVQFLSHQDEKIEKLSRHIEEEKQRLSAAFDSLIEEFTKQCSSQKEEAFQLLDKQVITLKLNYSYYKSKIDQYYGSDSEDKSSLTDKEVLIEKINKCQDTNEMEVLIKNIKDDIQEASNKQDGETKILEIKKGLLEICEELTRQSDSLPKSKFLISSDIQEGLRKLKSATDPLLEEFSQIEGQLCELTLSSLSSIDSSLVKKSDELILLRKWLAPSNGVVTLKLLYRGSRDGLDAQTFHDKCDNSQQTLSIAKNNLGKVFGGYSDQSWKHYDNYKSSEKSWVFSLDNKKKYPVTQSQTAIFAQHGFGPTFGSGYDLCIQMQGDISSSYFPTSYNSGDNPLPPIRRGKGAIFGAQNNGNSNPLTGAQQFYIEELEVYEVKMSS